MLLHQFKYEEKTKKQQLLFDNGVYLASRLTDGFHIYLYQVDQFYVEVYFDPEEEEIGYMKAFASPDKLSPYLKEIDISGLL